MGANHRSKFHSEVRVSHQTSQPANSQALVGFPGKGGQLQHQPLGRLNSRPVKVTTHQLPDFNLRSQFDGPGNMFKFPVTGDPIQKFFTPNLNPRTQVQNPGFQRFFESINNFGPQAQNPFETLTHNDGQLSITSPAVESPSDNESEASSIRSSASAYWPAELRFPTNLDDEDTGNLIPQKSGMKLRRKTSGRQPMGHNPHQRQRMLL